jgi:hypothetical protein
VLELVVRRHVAQRVYTVHSGPLVLVDDHMTAVVHGDPVAATSRRSVFGRRPVATRISCAAR